MAIAYTVGTLLIEDTFTRSGAIGSTESGSLGSLAWAGNTSQISTNGTQAVAQPLTSGTIWVTAAKHVRVEADITMVGGDLNFQNMGIIARGDGANQGSNQLYRESVTGYRPRFTLPAGTLGGSYIGSSRSAGKLIIDVIGDDWSAFYDANSTTGSSGVNRSATRVGLRWQSYHAGDVFRWERFRVYELVPTSPPVLTHTGAMTT